MGIVCALFVTVFAVAVYALASQLSKNASRSAQKIQATQMAETGINTLYAQIIAAFDASSSTPSWPTSISSTTISHTSGSKSYSDGSFTASVINSSSASGSGSTTVYTFVIEGDGTSPDGASKSKVRTTFTVTGSSSSSGASAYAFPVDAIVSNGAVNVNNGGNTTDSAGNNKAGIMANGQISVYWGSSVAGLLQTTSAEVSASQANCYQQTVTAMSTPLSLPTSSQVSSWQTSWLSIAKEATPSFASGNINSSASYNGTTTITAPAYYSGDLTIGWGTTTIQPDSTATKPYVVYVHGNIALNSGGTLINNGAIIVCDGTVTCDNGTTYSTGTSSTSALIDLNSNSTAAVTLAGGTNINIGMIYTPNGGITDNNGANVNGCLIAGSSTSTITLAGGARINYIDGLASSIPIVPGSGSANYTSSKVAGYYRLL